MAWGALGIVGQGHPEDYTDFVFKEKLRGDTNSQQVNTLAEEFLDYNEDEANLNIFPEAVDIEEIIDDLKSVANEEDLRLEKIYIHHPLITTAQARSHLTELVQHLDSWWSQSSITDWFSSLESP